MSPKTGRSFRAQIRVKPDLSEDLWDPDRPVQNYIYAAPICHPGMGL